MGAPARARPLTRLSARLYPAPESQYLSFVSFATVIAVAPGPDTFVTLRQSVIGGRAAGLWTVLGITVANAVLAFNLAVLPQCVGSGGTAAVFAGSLAAEA